MHFAGLIRVDESVLQPERYRNYNFIKAKRFYRNLLSKQFKEIIFHPLLQFMEIQKMKKYQKMIQQIL